MLGLMVLHIVALLCWLACLLYLPMLIAGSDSRLQELINPRHKFGSAARLVFTQIAGPAAIVAIVAGTLLIVVTGTTAPWLAAKLALVSLLVVGHTLLGLLVLRVEADNNKPVQPWCTLLLVFFSLLAVTIIWLVLSKPDWEVSRWIS